MMSATPPPRPSGCVDGFEMIEGPAAKTECAAQKKEAAKAREVGSDPRSAEGLFFQTEGLRTPPLKLEAVSAPSDRPAPAAIAEAPTSQAVFKTDQIKSYPVSKEAWAQLCQDATAPLHKPSEDSKATRSGSQGTTTRRRTSLCGIASSISSVLLMAALIFAALRLAPLAHRSALAAACAHLPAGLPPPLTCPAPPPTPPFGIAIQRASQMADSLASQLEGGQLPAPLRLTKQQLQYENLAIQVRLEGAPLAARAVLVDRLWDCARLCETAAGQLRQVTAAARGAVDNLYMYSQIVAAQLAAEDRVWSADKMGRQWERFVALAHDELQAVLLEHVVPSMTTLAELHSSSLSAKGGLRQERWQLWQHEADRGLFQVLGEAVGYNLKRKTMADGALEDLEKGEDNVVGAMAELAAMKHSLESFQAELNVMRKFMKVVGAIEIPLAAQRQFIEAGLSSLQDSSARLKARRDSERPSNLPAVVSMPNAACESDAGDC